MAGFNIGNLQRPVAAQGAASAQAMSADTAHQTLSGYSAHLKSSGGFKEGVIRLKTNAGGDTQIYRDRAYHFRSRSGEGSGVGEAGRLTRDMFARAYEGKLSQAAHTKLMEGLDAYLLSRGGQMGTRSFERFFQAFERAVGREQALAQAAERFQAGLQAGPVKISEQALAFLQGKDSTDALSSMAVSSPESRRADQEADERSSSSLNLSFAKPINPKSPEYVAKVQDGVSAIYGAGGGSIAPIGDNQGAKSNPFLIDSEAGKSVLVVPRDQKVEVNTNSFGTGEIAAALALRPMPHVARPTEFVLTVELPLTEQLSHTASDGKRIDIAGSYKQAYRVPADQVRGFIESIHEQEDGSKIFMTAVRMPAGAKTTLEAAVGEKPLEPREFAQFAAGLYLALDEMGKAKLIHHDIKAANITYDREKGEVMLIDLGGAVRVDGEDGKTRIINDHNELTKRPGCTTDVGLDGQKTASPHGLEYDRYGFALMLLSSLAPSVSNQTGPVLREIFSLPVPAQGGRVGQLLDKLSDPSAAVSPLALHPELRLKAIKSLGDFKSQLDEAFSRDPAARGLVEQALTAGLTEGPTSDAAWRALGGAIKERALQVDAGSANTAALKNLFPAEAQSLDGDGQLPFAGDPAGRSEDGLLNRLPNGDPYDS